MSLVLLCWNVAMVTGPNRILFIPEMVGPFLEMTLIPEIGSYQCLVRNIFV